MSLFILTFFLYQAELQRTRKKLESDVAELETSLEHANQV